MCCERAPPLGAAYEVCCIDQCCATGLICCGGECCDPEGCCEGVCCGSGGAVAGGGPTCGVDVYLKDITFGNDCTMYEEAAPCEAGVPSNCWGAGAALTGIDWVDQNNPDHPICYVRGNTMRLTVRFETKGSVPGTGMLRVVGPDGVVGQQEFNVPCGGGLQTRYVTITTSALPNVVKAYTPAALQWQVRGPGETAFSYVATTSHRIYVTYGTPADSEPTDQRMNFLCYAAAQAGTPLEVVEGVESESVGIHKRLNTSPPNEPPEVITPEERASHEVPDWRLMSGSPYWGECDEQANFMNLCLVSLGAPGGTVHLIRASTDTDPLGPLETTTAAELGLTEDLDGDGVGGETDEVLRLIFDFEPPPALERFWNNFEAALETAGGFYAVWPNFSAPSACELLLTLLRPISAGGHGATQHWVYDRPDGTRYYTTAVPRPASCP